jgi:hypothetical protein
LDPPPPLADVLPELLPELPLPELPAPEPPLALEDPLLEPPEPLDAELPLLPPDPSLAPEEPLLEPPDVPDVDAPLEPDVASTAPASLSAAARVEPPQAAARARVATVAEMFAADRFIAPSS